MTGTRGAGRHRLPFPSPFNISSLQHFHIFLLSIFLLLLVRLIYLSYPVSSHRDVPPFRDDGRRGRVAFAAGPSETSRHPVEQQERLREAE